MKLEGKEEIDREWFVWKKKKTIPMWFTSLQSHPNAVRVRVHCSHSYVRYCRSDRASCDYKSCKWMRDQCLPPSQWYTAPHRSRALQVRPDTASALPDYKRWFLGRQSQLQTQNGCSLTCKQTDIDELYEARTASLCHPIGRQGFYHRSGSCWNLQQP